MQFRTIQRADVLVAILTPPAIIGAVLGDKLPNLLIAGAVIAAVRAIFVRSVLAAYRAGGASRPPRRRLASVHSLANHRIAQEDAGAGKPATVGVRTVQQD